MFDVINDLYAVILSRKESAAEGSYTGYLFREGLDKILKKVGEESSETIIAAKSLQADAADAGKRADLANEVCDLLYHLLVLLAERDVPLEEVEEILRARAEKQGNLKEQKVIDKNS
ncbi:MAG: phosphoribosyl-ATP diphosphatase [Clostridiales Family XIII bacterium]|jgi:phosphoribosyl-ATP pyrophosphohydrolase|nr:phosphoribosyl-ATP diphosphatase [Clostridiales Family XIII bacterium]